MGRHRSGKACTVRTYVCVCVLSPAKGLMCLCCCMHTQVSSQYDTLHSKSSPGQPRRTPTGWLHLTAFKSIFVHFPKVPTLLPHFVVSMSHLCVSFNHSLEICDGEPVSGHWGWRVSLTTSRRICPSFITMLLPVLKEWCRADRHWMRVNKSGASRSWTKNSNTGTGSVGSREHTHCAPSLAKFRPLTRSCYKSEINPQTIGSFHFPSTFPRQHQALNNSLKCKSPLCLVS